MGSEAGGDGPQGNYKGGPCGGRLSLWVRPAGRTRLEVEVLYWPGKGNS